MELKYKKWEDISITNWRRIKDVLNDNTEEIEKRVGLLSILCDCDENEIWNLGITELNPLMKQIGWIDSFDYPKDIKFKRIKIQDIECVIETDLQKFTIAQYVDFQNLYKDFEKNIGSILTCFIIPKGKTYGEGYDTVEFAKIIEDNLSIVQSNSICFFFLKKSLSLIRASQIYLDWEMKRMKKKTDSKAKAIVEKYKTLMDTYGHIL